MTQPQQQRGFASNSHSPALFASLTRKPKPAEGAKDAQDAQQAAFKSTRRHVLEQVRNDWFFEPSSGTSSVQSPSTPRPDLHLDVKEWRAREQEDTSGSDQEDEQRRLNGGPTPGGSRDPYRFEDPDALEQAMLDRKRKRRKVLEDEMQWNEGLRTWVARRDAWTGAKPPAAQNSISAGSLPLDTSDENTVTSPSDKGDVEMAEAENFTPTQSGSPSTTGTGLSPHALPSAETEETLIPVVQPTRLYGNNVRATVKPSTYSSIYSRLIVQSNSPAVPLNLKHVTRALVHGWKQNGEWPPKPTPRVDVPVVKKRSGNSAAAASPAMSPEAAGPADIEVQADEKTRRSGSIGGAVKKVFNLTSSRRFSLRSHSRDSENLPKEHATQPPEEA